MNISFVVTGISHIKNIDLKNWKGNQKNSGFLPEERAWMDDIFYKENFIDVFSRAESKRRTIHMVV